MANSHICTGHEISSDTCEKRGKSKRRVESGVNFCIFKEKEKNRVSSHFMHASVTVWKELTMVSFLKSNQPYTQYTSVILFMTLLCIQ